MSKRLEECSKMRRRFTTTGVWEPRTIFYGLACECALKAVLCGYGVIEGTKPPRHLKVHIDKIWDEYGTNLQGRGMPPLGPNPFTGWQVYDRYRDDAVFSQNRVAGHRNGALEGMKALQLAAEQGLVL